MYEKELQILGLSEKESTVYLAALELGPDTAQNLAKKAGINRPTTYVQIESLKKKGLMGEVEQGKKTLYVAETPERLEMLLDLFEKDLQFKKAEVARVLPSLLEMFAGQGDRPKVRFFKGKEAVIAITKDYLNVKDKKIESLTNLDRVLDIFPKHMSDYTIKRVARGIKGYVIYTRQAGPLPELNDPGKLREVKYVSSDKLSFSADINIYDDKVAISTYKEEPVSIVVESKMIADTMRSIFYFIWNGLEK